MIAPYVFWFAVFGFAGWLFECIYGAIVTHHWENRGFLFGPLCPIYGVGAVSALLVFNLSGIDVARVPWWSIFLGSMVGSAALEYGVSYVFEKIFGAVWWDYSNLPFNLNGRICLPASILFGLAGLAIAYLVFPVTNRVDSLIPPLLMEAMAFIIVGLIAADSALTVVTLSDLMEKISLADDILSSHMESLITTAYSAGQAIPQAIPQVRPPQLSVPQLPPSEYLKDTAANLTHYQRLLMHKIHHVTSKRAMRAFGFLRDARSAIEEAAKRPGRR